MDPELEKELAAWLDKIVISLLSCTESITAEQWELLETEMNDAITKRETEAKIDIWIERFVRNFKRV